MTPTDGRRGRRRLRAADDRAGDRRALPRGRVARRAARCRPAAHRRRGPGLGRPAGPRPDEVWVAERDGALVGYATLTARLARRPLRRCPTRRAAASVGRCSTSSRRCTPTASACGSSRRNVPARASTHATASSSSSAPTARATRSAPPTSGWPGRGGPAAFLPRPDRRGRRAARRPAGPPGRAHPRGAGAQARSRAATPARERGDRRGDGRRTRPSWARSGSRRIMDVVITESLDAARRRVSRADRRRPAPARDLSVRPGHDASVRFA